MGHGLGFCGRWALACLMAGVCLAGPLGTKAAASAPDAAVVEALTRHGGLGHAHARRVVSAVSEALAANADRGGDRYDRLRQSIGAVLFGDRGPGATRPVYEARLAQVLTRMYRGLDELTLHAIFVRGYDVPACQQDLGLAARDCGALIAAAAAGTGRAAAAETRARDTAAEAEQARAQARADFAGGRYPQALLGYRRALRLSPGHAGSHAGAGACQLALARAHDAVASYRAAVAIDPGRAGFHAALGRALTASGDHASAVASYRHALQLDPNNGPARQGLARLAPAPSRSPSPAAGGRALPSNRFPRYQGPRRFDPSKAPAAAPAVAAKRGAAPSAKGPSPASSEPVHATGDLLERAAQAASDALAHAPAASRKDAGKKAPASKAHPQDDLMADLMADPLGGASTPERAREQSDSAGEAATQEGAGEAAADAEVEALELETEAPLPDIPSREAVGAVLKALTPFVGECLPAHRGLLKVRITIDGPTGAVASTVVDNGEGDPKGCIDAVVGVAAFPRFKRPTFTVGYPFRL